MRRIEDFPLSRQKDEHVPGPGLTTGLDLLEGGQELRFETLFEGVVLQVAHGHRIGPPADLDDGSVAEVLREGRHVDGRAGDDELQIPPLGQHGLQIAEEKVDVQTPLVGFVDDDAVVAGQAPVAANLREQQSVREQLHPRCIADRLGEAHGVADGSTEGNLELFGDPRRHRSRGQAPGLRMADHPPLTEPRGEGDLRQLGGFSRARLPGHDDNLVVYQRIADGLRMLRDRQLRRKLELQRGSAALEDSLTSQPKGGYGSLHSRRRRSLE